MLKKLLIKLTGNLFFQRILEKSVFISQYLMGIGSGSEVSTSGERAIFVVLMQRFKPPYCIFDVGSNKGQFVQLVLENVKAADIQIHCFEPGRETFRILASASEGAKRIKLNNVAIGKEKGEADLYSDNPGSGLASLTKRRLDHLGVEFNQSEKVALRTIDDYCTEQEIDHIHMLKIDVEGHELDVLIGAQRMFNTRSIDVVTFEFGGCNIDTRTYFQDIWYFFEEIDMKICRITPSGYLHPIEAYIEMHEQFRTTNFIAISNG